MDLQPTVEAQRRAVGRRIPCGGVCRADGATVYSPPQAEDRRGPGASEVTLPWTVRSSRRVLACTLASVVCMTLVPILSVARLAAAQQRRPPPQTAAPQETPESQGPFDDIEGPAPAWTEMIYRGNHSVSRSPAYSAPCWRSDPSDGARRNGRPRWCRRRSFSRSSVR